MSKELTAPEFWALQSDNLTVEEISTAAVVAKSTDTIFTQDDAAKLLDKFQNLFQIHIEPLPPWLRSIKLSRAALILGARMRHIKNPKVMDGLDISKLSGLVTFVVLCCRYTEETSSITEILERMVAGNLGNLVRVQMGQEDLGVVFRNLRAHLSGLAVSTIDADKNSDVSNRAISWIRQLQTFGRLDWAPTELLARNWQATIQLMVELLSEVDPAGEAPEACRREEDQHASPWAKVHDTLHLTSAQIALAAAAHNASVAVECISENSSIILPRSPDPEEQESTFLVRLWLKQPPDCVHSILRGRERNTDRSVNDGQKTDDINVVGGVKEIVLWMAKKLDLHCLFAPGDKNLQVLLKLWESGAQFGKTMRWETQRQESKMRLSLFDNPHCLQDPTLTEHQLARDFLENRQSSRDSDIFQYYLSQPPLQTLIISAVRAIQVVYRSCGYEGEINDAPLGISGDPTAAILFYITSVSIQALQNTVHPDSDSLDTYALNLSALCENFEGPVEIDSIATTAIRGLVNGLEPADLIPVAAMIWGGERHDIIQYVAEPRKPGIGIIGIVSPHCAVILDVIRQPLDLYEKAIANNLPPLLSIWRGAVPLLPRDARGCVNAPNERTRGNRLPIGQQNPITRIWDIQPRMPLLVTFDVLSAVEGTGTFCFWYAGHLVAEFSPYLILLGLVSTRCSWRRQEQNSTPDKIHFRMSKRDLLDIAGFDIDQDSVVSIEDIGDPTWFIFSIGCVTNYSSGPLDIVTMKDILPYVRNFSIERARTDDWNEQTHIIFEWVLHLPRYYSRFNNATVATPTEATPSEQGRRGHSYLRR